MPSAHHMFLRGQIRLEMNDAHWIWKLGEHWRALPEHFQKPGHRIKSENPSHFHEFLPHRHYWMERLTHGRPLFISRASMPYELLHKLSQSGPCWIRWCDIQFPCDLPTTSCQTWSFKKSFYLRFIKIPRSDLVVVVGGGGNYCPSLWLNPCGLHSTGFTFSKEFHHWT